MKPETREKLSQAAKRNWDEVKAHEARMAAPRAKRYGYRDGKTMVVVDLTPAEHEALVQLKLQFRRSRKLTRDDGRPVALADVVKEAIRRMLKQEGKANG